MHILLTNDDGIESSLLHVVVNAAAKRGHHVTVCAPASQQSAKSHAFTVSDPLLVRKVSIENASEAWAVHGTPVDSCRLGLMNLAKEPVDMVISGINYGYNVGLAVFLSGTVGAAREAAFRGVKSMALSLEPNTPDETILFFADYAIRLAEKLLNYESPAFSVCNVNAPQFPVKSLQSPVLCTLNQHIYKDYYHEVITPRNDRYFFLAPEEQDDTPTPGCDVDMLQQGHVTITFLTPEGCDQQAFSDFPLPLNE